MSSGLTDRRFRANARYELVLLDRLAAPEREALGAPDGQDDLYGMLRPRAGSALEPRSASTDVALLFLTLADPAPLPAYAVERLGGELEDTVTRLVLDGVLEVEHEGAYLCGPAAAELLVVRRSGGGQGRLGELTVAALRYGQELTDLPAPLLALRLYFYGRRPISPELERRLSDGGALAEYLGVGPGGSSRPALDAGWHALPPRHGEEINWLTWHPRRVGPATGGRPAYKLYVSPAVDALDAAVEAVATSLAAARGVTAFKVGANVPGICRPDKLVVYFDRLDDLRTGADVLRERLAGCPPHGVPFTAAVTRDGLLSWGADPPPAASRAETTSWRMWVTERLAEYLIGARRSGSNGLEPWRFALERLRLSGIDTDTWVPANDMWPAAFASS